MGRPQKFPPLLIILATILVLWLLSRILFIPESKKVDQVIMTGKKAVENEDLSKVMSLVYDNYQDDFGMDYQQLEKWFINHFRLYNDIKILIPYKKISVKENVAVCSLRVSIGARDLTTNEYEIIYGYSAWGDELILDLTKSDGKWQFTNAHP
jgi:hypothetical protein